MDLSVVDAENETHSHSEESEPETEQDLNLVENPQSSDVECQSL